jgi:hypothetical protein
MQKIWEWTENTEQYRTPICTNIPNESLKTQARGQYTKITQIALTNSGMIAS